MATTGVAQRNIELARKGYAAFEAGDVETVMSLLSDQVVWHVLGSGPLAGDHAGKAAVMELFGNYMGLIDSQSTEIHDILANDQHTLVMATLKVSRQGRSIEHKITDVVHPDPEGRVQEFWRFFDDRQGRRVYVRLVAPAGVSAPVAHRTERAAPDPTRVVRTGSPWPAAVRFEFGGPDGWSGSQDPSATPSRAVCDRVVSARRRPPVPQVALGYPRQGTPHLDGRAASRCCSSMCRK